MSRHKAGCCGGKKNESAPKGKSCHKCGDDGQGHSILFFGNIALNVIATSEYLDPGYSGANPASLAPVIPQLRCPVTGTFQNLIVQQSPSSPPESVVTITYRLRINNVPTALTVDITTAETTRSVAADVPVAEGDLLDLEVVHDALGQVTPGLIVVSLGLRA